MELIGSLFLILALAVVVALYIGRPFLLKTGQKTVSTENDREHQLSTLLAERDRVLNSLQELDFDYSLGKVPAEEYPQQRDVLLKSGADILRRLDEMTAVSPGTSRVEAEERIEAAVAARRADAMQPAAVGPNGYSNGKDELEELIALRKRQRKESAAGFCPSCGKPAQKSDRFCSKCGATL